MGDMRWQALLVFGLVLTFVAPPTAAQNGLPPDLALLGRIRGQITRDLKQQPPLACRLLLERGTRKKGRRFDAQDTLKLDMTMQNGQELLSGSAARRLKEPEWGEVMAAPGTTGNGHSDLFLRSIFLSASPRFFYEGEEDHNGRATHRFAYRISRLDSGYTLSGAGITAKVPYRGRFWVDRESLDIVRLEVEAEEIPAELKLKAVTRTTEYGRQKVGNTELLLPGLSEFATLETGGTEKVSQARLSDCRLHAEESRVITQSVERTPQPAPPKPVPTPVAAAPPPVEKAPPPAPPKPSAVSVAEPAVAKLASLDGLAGMRVETQLEPAHGVPAVGTAMTFRLSRDLRRGDEVIAPKGARLAGRITRWNEISNRQGAHLVTLEFTELHVGDVRLPWTGQVTRVLPLADSVRPSGMPSGVLLPTSARTPTADTFLAALPPNTVTLIMLGNTMPRMLQIEWRVQGGAPPAVVASGARD